ncbi:cation diffusion facilitator family transporter [Rubellimicrobium roseum]|uniref:Cation diffusion facilitator family transporter n=1 Tax=Rubellimicrobium roseum TaxID=687525 RepID=A0A5C4NJR1_9RHOB|nr:cation diffusion facilitator family transporter [Rubellimicrobium roseum]TNC74823.1 cation diffusion facilitator family transporter [Rubellimicrobium roseum]
MAQHGHDHGHGHGHGHGGGHGPSHAHGASERALGVAALLTGTFLVAEVVGGLVSGSLALLADAGHMLTDVASLVLAWVALRLARRPATWKRTYGFDRLSVLAAFVNGLALFVIAVWIAVEAWERLRDPGPVLGGVMLWIALGGLVVNIAAFWVLTRGGPGNLNLRAAALHVAGDLLGSVAALGAALVILGTGWTPIDPLLSVLVALILLRSAWRVVAESGHILLEGAPAGFDAREVAADLTAQVPGVARVHHVHAWSITEERPMVTLEAEAAPGADPRAVRRALKARLRDRWAVGHATVEVDEAGEA